MPGGTGVIGKFNLSFDAKRIVFGWKASEWEGFRIYEANIDGSGVRQITFPPDDEELRIKKYDQSGYLKFAKIYHHQTDDMHPCYLPDGGFAFISTRCQFSTLCHGGDAFTTTVLYRMDANADIYNAINDDKGFADDLKASYGRDVYLELRNR